MKKLNLQATHNLYIYIYRILASFLLVFGLVFTGYAVTIFDEPKVSFSGDSGMSSVDQQYIDKKLKDLENLINSRLVAMENRVNTAIKNNSGIFAQVSYVPYGGGRKAICPGGYTPVKLKLGTVGTGAGVATCFKGSISAGDRDHGGGGHH